MKRSMREWGEGRELEGVGIVVRGKLGSPNGIASFCVCF